MNDQTLFYPWAAQWTTVVEILLGGAALIIGLYLAARSGRVESKGTEDQPIEHSYAGLISTTENRPTTFVVLFSVAVGILVIGYVVQLALHGLKY